MWLSQLREIRRRARMSQEELAARSGVARRTIIYLEAGRGAVNLATVRKLASALDLEPGDLVGAGELVDVRPLGLLRATILPSSAGR
jgi:transcriptional regulator with XRE-family HTH domain